MFIGVDWGGTKIEVAALGSDGSVLARVRQPTPRGDYDGCLALIRELVQRVESDLGRRGTVGVGIPGSLEPASRLGKGGSSTWINGRPVEADLAGVLDRPVRVENDADCLAVSEAVDGAGRSYRVVFAAIIASGTGAGIAIDGRAHHGPNNSAGEWGHNPLPYPTLAEIPGAACYCGRHGCLETWLSGYAFARDYAHHSGIEATAPQVMARRREGDRLADQVYRRYVDRAARGLAAVVNTLDPDVIVLGGGMSNVPELYDDLPGLVAGHVFSTVFTTPIRRAAHGDSSGVRGAAWLWRDPSPTPPAALPPATPGGPS